MQSSVHQERLLAITFGMMMIEVGFRIFNQHCAATIDTYVSVNFVLSEGIHPRRWAEDALQTDPGRRLAILASGQDSSGIEWCRGRGDKAAMRANTYFDLVTGAEVTLTDHHIPRRCYRVLGAKKQNIEQTPQQLASPIPSHGMNNALPSNQ